MKTLYLPILLLLVYALAACEARRQTMPEQTTPAATTENLDTARLSTLDTLRTDTLATNPTDSLATAPPVKAADKYLISFRQAGPIKINMPIADLKKMIPAGQRKETEITREGRRYKAYEISPQANQGNPSLRVEELCEPTCRVWRIQVMDSTYKTNEGLGIGATLGEIKKQYPITYVGTGETGIVAVSETKKITFTLDVSKLPAKQLSQLNQKNAPDDVRVKSLLLL